ncbi:MAG TPA: TIGR03936 family radical SAM-associated protein [Anaerolineales bacterium]|nr:TIGR03936 family radical SAM-associated protein [Anaerolineales bacterium]
MRLRLTYAKTDAMRFTGHLDVHRTLYRTLMRARLPIAFSQGFTRRPKLVMSGALPLGFTSDCEMADLWLDESMSIDKIASAIRSVSPPGLQLHSLEELDLSVPKVQNQIVSAEFLVTLLDPIPNLDEKIAALLAASHLPRERKKKVYDLRPLVLDLKRIEDDDEEQRLQMTLQAREGATGRPDEVVAELGGNPLAARYHRMAIHLE